ncbi:MAG: hypothetical protein JNL94_03105 [Planctomycetes bacterium]|nr:hypothetical protein [Planctomycetota bacterium]
MSFHHSIVAACLALVAASASAQSVPASISGRLVPGTYCGNQGIIIEHTSVGVAFVTTVDLSGLGQQVTVTGMLNQPGPCEFMLASGATNSAFQVFTCNAPALGCEVSVDMCPSPADGSYVLFGSFATATIPVSQETGTFLLDPNFMFLFAAGQKTAVCEAVRFFIPNIPAAVGVDVFFQGAHIPVSGFPLLSNVTKMTIQPPIPGCQYFECF